jgi:hypothetical protein
MWRTHHLNELASTAGGALMKAPPRCGKQVGDAFLPYRGVHPPLKTDFDTFSDFKRLILIKIDQYTRAGQLTEAFSAAKAAVAADPSCPVVRRVYQDIVEAQRRAHKQPAFTSKSSQAQIMRLLREAESCRRDGDLAGCVEACNEVLAIDPTCAAALTKRGVCNSSNASQKERKNAENDLHLAMQLGTKRCENQEGMQYLRANSHLYAGTATGAAKAYLQKKCNPDHIGTQMDDKKNQKWQGMI